MKQTPHQNISEFKKFWDFFFAVLNKQCYAQCYANTHGHAGGQYYYFGMDLQDVRPAKTGPASHAQMRPPLRQLTSVTIAVNDADPSLSIVL